jgi:peptidylprolyl isomerase
MRLLILLGGLLMTLAAAVPANAADIPAGLDPENTLVLTLTQGDVIIKLRPDLAPKHVEQIKTLTRRGFYDGIIFHRVIDGFMAQTGDPTGTGMGGSDLANVPAEFSPANFGRGTVGAARSSDPNSANSQFFICFDDASFLNNQYTVWGEVVSGMEFVDQIQKGEPPANPDKIVKLRVLADAQKGEAATGPAGEKLSTETGTAPAANAEKH